MNRLLAGLVALVSLAGAAYAARYAIAEARVANVAMRLHRGDPTSLDFDALAARLAPASAFLERDPKFHELRAALLRAQTEAVTGWGARRRLLEGAVAETRHAVELRPTWARGYARLVLDKAALREFDEEMAAAMVAAVDNGPREIGVIMAVGTIGPLLWNDLDARGREAVRRAVMNGLDHAHSGYRRRFTRVFRRNCALLPDVPICQPAGISSG